MWTTGQDGLEPALQRGYAAIVILGGFLCKRVTVQLNGGFSVTFGLSSTALLAVWVECDGQTRGISMRFRALIVACL
jgi:hypothetical protein